MNLRVTLSQIFAGRGFFGLIASAWGFMLGGSLLMTMLTHQLAFAGFSRYSVVLYQIVVLGMLCGAAWIIMELEYQKKTVKKPTDFAAVFLLSALFGALIPIIFAIGAVVTGRDELRQRAAARMDSLKLRRKQGGLTGFLRELMNRSFLKLAH